MRFAFFAPFWLTLGLLAAPALAQKPKRAPNPGGDRPQANAPKQGMFDSELKGKAAPVAQNNDPITVMDTARVADQPLRIVQQGNLMGVTNDTGKVILPIEYDEVVFFNKKDSACSRWDGVLRIKKGAFYGLSQPSGKPLTTLTYEDLNFFPETCGNSHAASYVVKAKLGGKYGLISGKGDIIIRPSYDDLWLLRNEKERVTNPEVAVVRRANKYGMMELRGGQIFKTEYDRIEYLQSLEVESKNKTERHLLLRLRQGDKWGLVNLTTKEQFDLDFEEIMPFGPEGLARVRKGGKYGFIDPQSKLKINCQYEQAGSFRQGLALVAKGSKWGVLAPDKREVIKPAYEAIEHLLPEEKKNPDPYFAALFKVKKDGKWGVAYKDGKLVVPCHYDGLEFLPRKFGFNATQAGKTEFVELPAQVAN
jgi:WG containing repeat